MPYWLVFQCSSCHWEYHELLHKTGYQIYLTKFMLKMRTRKETEFYIKADAIMNKVAWHRSWFGRIFYPSKLRQYMITLRKLEFYATPPPIRKVLFGILHICFTRYAMTV